MDQCHLLRIVAGRNGTNTPDYRPASIKVYGTDKQGANRRRLLRHGPGAQPRVEATIRQTRQSILT